MVANGMRMDTSGVAKKAQFNASFSCARGLRARSDGTMNSHHIQKPNTCPVAVQRMVRIEKCQRLDRGRKVHLDGERRGDDLVDEGQ